MGEGGKPEALTPEQYRAAEGLDSAEPVPQEQVEQDLEYEAALPDHVAEELDRINVRGAEVLRERRTPPDAPSAAPTTTREGGMHQPVDSDAELELSRAEAMAHAFDLAAVEYEKAKQEATAEMQSNPHTRETLLEFFALQRAHRTEQDNLKESIGSGQWTDPAVISGIFTHAAEQLREFARSHPANS